jgi:16S rRNA G1207 methylase RsmC
VTNNKDQTAACNHLPSIAPAERLAVEIASDVAASRILCISLGRAQGAWRLAEARPQAAVQCWYLDLYRKQLAASDIAERGERKNLELVCQADFPAEPIDLVVLPFSVSGEAELARDLLQSAYQQLTIGGTLIASVNNEKDRWLHEQLENYSTKIEITKNSGATAYRLIKKDPVKRVRSFECHFKFRDQGNLIQAYSRPGVFSHRHIDPGARHLLTVAQVTPEMKILDIGCGCGTVGMALAKRDPSVTVHGVDSNARAVACMWQGGLLNGLSPQIACELNSEGISGLPGTYDLVAANPPYYADFRIAEHFIATAKSALKTRGKLLIVTKAPDWYEEKLTGHWHHVQIQATKQYFVVEATAPA